MPDPKASLARIPFEQFAAAVRRAHPQLQEAAPDLWAKDDLLTHAMVKAYPELGEHTIDPFEGTEGVALPNLSPNVQPGAPPSPIEPLTTYRGFGDRVLAAEVDAVASPYTGGKRVLQGLQGLGKVFMGDGREDWAGPTPPGTQTAPQINREAYAKPYADIAGGIAEASQVLLLPALAMAPEVTIPALAGGIAASEGVNYGAPPLLGTTPAETEVLSNLAGLGAGVGIGGKIHAKGAFAERLQGPPISPLENEGWWGQARGKTDQMLQDQASWQAIGLEVTEAEGRKANLAIQLAKDRAEELASSPGPFDYLDNLTTVIRNLPPEEVAGIDPGMIPPGLVGTEPPPGFAEGILQRGNQRRIDEALAAHEANPATAAMRAVRDGQQGPPGIEQRMLPPLPEETIYAPLEEGQLQAGTEGELGGPVKLSESIRSLGRRLQSQLETQPLSKPPITDQMKLRQASNHEYKTEWRAAVKDLASEMEYHTHQKGGGTLKDDAGNVIGRQGAVAGSDIYWKIVEGVDNPPARRVITDVLRVLADTEATKVEEIPKEYLAKFKEANSYGPRQFETAYKRWMSRVLSVADRRVNSRLESNRRASRIAAEDAARMAAETSEEGGPPAIHAESSVGSSSPLEDPSPGPSTSPDLSSDLSAGAPPKVLKAPKALEEIPDWVTDDTVVDEPGGWEPEELKGQAPNTVDQAELNIPQWREQLRTAMEESGSDPNKVDKWIRDSTGYPRDPEKIADMLHSRGQAMGVRLGRVTSGDKAGRVPGEEGVAGVEGVQGIQGVQGVENGAPPVAEVPFALEREAGEGPPSGVPALPSMESWAPELSTRPGRKPFRERIKGEEGTLVIDPSIINDIPGMKKWLKSKEAEYGHEGWHEAATDALEEGDVRSAFRIAALASGRSMVGAVARPAVDAGADKDVIRSARQEASDLLANTIRSQRKATEQELGHALPSTVDVSKEGIITFNKLGGKGVPILKVSATDRELGGALMSDMLQQADPSQILRVLGNKDKALQVTSQIADQIIREYPDQTIADMAELMGFKDLPLAEQRIEVARATRRGYSLAGKKLGEAGNWSQKHADVMYLLEPVDETGEAGELGSVGAMQARGIRTSEGFVQWLGKQDLNSKDLAEEGFRLPKGVPYKDAKGNLTPQAKTYARNWFRRAGKREEAQKSIDALAEKGTALEKALIRSNIAGESRANGGTLSQLSGVSRAFMIAKLSTAQRNFRNQGARYAFNMLDDLIAGTFASVTGDEAAAKLHFAEARNLARIPTGAANTVKLLTSPWVDGLQAIFDYSNETIAGLPEKDVRRFLSLVEEFPRWESKMLGSLSLDADGGAGGSKLAVLNKLTSPEVRNTVTVFNRIQEHFWRASVADSVFRAQLELAGQDPNIALRDPKGLIDLLGEDKVDSMMGTAISSALDATFAGDTIPGTLPDILLDIFSRNTVAAPLLQMGFPFPRFNLASAPRWLWDHFPLAPITDLLAYKVMGTNDNNLGKGRYTFMKQLERSGSDAEKLHIEIQKEEYTAAKSLGEFMEAKEDAREAAKVFKHLEAKAEKDHTIPGLQEDMGTAAEDMQERIRAADGAQNSYKAANARIKNLESQRANVKKTRSSLQEAGVADSPAKYWAQKTTGALLFTAAYLLRDSAGAKATQWYEWAFDHKDEEDPTKPKSTLIDLRGEAPFVQPLFLAEVAHDIWNNTSWDKFHEAVKGGATYAQAMKSFYTGKYTMGSFFKDALEAYLSITPAAGTTKDILEQFTGRTAQGETVDADTVQRALLGSLGELIARFSSPLDMVSDLAGGVDEESAKARIPAKGGKEKPSKLAVLADPTIANIPGANRTIPEKISPFSGEPIQGLHPELRQLLGVTLRQQTAVEEELKAAGFPIGGAVPRQTGDRELDNQVNKAFAGLLQKYWPRVQANARYNKLTPELKRDVLDGLFKQLKDAAYGTVARTLPREDAKDMVQSAASQDKIARWKRFLDGLRAEVAPATPEAPEPDRRDTEPEPEPGAPPPPPF